MRRFIGVCAMKTSRPLILCALLLLAGCATQAPLTWNADKIAANRSTYTRLNDAKGETIATVSTERARRLIAIKNRIVAASSQPADLLVMSGKEPNAMSTRGKNGRPIIAVNLGMMDLLQNDDDAYAAVIGHELAHLVLGHGTIRKQREDTRQGISSILGTVLGTAGVPGGNIIADLGTKVVTTAYSRDEERDADHYSIDYIKRAGFNPQGAVRAWERMSAVPSGFSIPFLSSHPQSAERLETMKRLVAE